MATKVIMPQLGESVVEGTVTKWLKTEGDSISEYEALLEVNTDKVDSEIPSPGSGTVLKILVGEGETVDAGSVLCWIGEPGEDIPAATEKIQVEDQLGTPESSVTPETQPEIQTGKTQELGFISPVVARIASENNVNLTEISGSGKNGRITKNDILNYIERSKTIKDQPIWETPADGDLFRPTELIFGDQPAEGEKSKGTDRILSLTPVRKSIANHMVNSKHSSPHVTTVMEADLHLVVDHRNQLKNDFEQQGTKLTFMPYIIQAVVRALRDFPIANSSWTDEGILLKNDINIGIATSLGDEGLIVPVIKNADQYSLSGLAIQVNDLAGKARSKKLQPDDVHGGTFTITNHGTGGSLFASPIINQPQCAILGVGIIQKRVVVINDAIAIRPMVYLSLTFDHRILDGAIADHFLGGVVEYLSNWR